MTPYLKPRQKQIWIVLILAIIITSFTLPGKKAMDKKVTIFVLADASGPSMDSPPVSWAIGQLEEALKDNGLTPEICHNLQKLDEQSVRIVISPGESKLARDISGKNNVSIPGIAESLAFINGEIENQKVLLVTGSDERGLVYGILELADRVTYCNDPFTVLQEIGNSTEQPVNTIRSMTRLFVSDIEDKSWFYDKSFWESYLSMLISQRFNRFSLTLGLGYDSPKEVTDSYFIFAYPYLVSVPGYENVKVKELPKGERERNLEMLQFISSEANRRGLHFQLGLWGHSYECVNSPDVNYTIEGLNPDIHADYCRNAVRTLLQACPEIDGITFRAHYESGIPDGSKGFWETVFDGVAECGRRVEIDLHAKGISYEQINMALETGQPVRVTPKFTAEHMGLPAQQAAIREMERVPSPNATNPRNSIARYGYSDFMSVDRKYDTYFRIWPGKQKILLWGDPAMASGYGRYAGFCGNLGIEVSEPLCFKGRQGSGVSPERRIYADNSLIPEGGNWQKYLYTYRLWGRYLYNPEADPESYRRYLRKVFGNAAFSVEKALGNSSRIIPLITSSHLPAGSAMTYWPEMYTNMPITNSGISHPYGDTPRPKVFGRVSPLDPAMFSPVNEFVDDFLNERPSHRYSPVDVASWLEKFANTSYQQLKIAEQNVPDASDPSFIRMSVDAKVQNAIGLFFANKLRSATAWMIHENNGNLDCLKDAIYFYQIALDSWEKITDYTENIYINKLGFGRFPHIRGHWKDRLPAIEQDLNVMKETLEEKTGESWTMPAGPSPFATKWLKARPPVPPCEHEAAESFSPGKPLEISIKYYSPEIQEIKLFYRHVNQVEAYNSASMIKKDGAWSYTIPAGFTDSEYQLMYYFVLYDEKGNSWIFPGFEEELANQPYFHVLQGGR